MGEVCDMGSVIMDEIALEGLDGITIEGLFVRLKGRSEFSTSLNEAFKNYIWNTICNFGEIDMFEIPEPRKPLVIFNRYDYVDPDLGMVLEPETMPEEIYPHAPVDDKKKGIRGSCSFYNERVSVYKLASELSLKEAEDRWGTKLVIVASQKMRNLALMGSSVDPELELTILQYCILERVGRSRHLGEVTQGRVSLQITGEDPKALFYHRKYLMKHGLIVKQIHHQKSGSQNCSGSLLHLPRFYVERWPKVLFLTKRVVEILRGCKDYLADYDEIRKKLGLTNSLKKLFQTTYFQRFVRTDLRLPYRHLYPDAKENEWRSLNSLKEKMIRVIQLLDPNADVDIVSTKDEEFDVDDEEHGEANSSHGEFCVTLNRSFLSQVYQCVEGAGVNGYSQMQLVQKMGLPKLSARTVSRNLLKRGVASTFMNDVGRQRVSRFRARKWDRQCTRIQTIERDIQHMRAELLNKAMGAGHEIPSTLIPVKNLTGTQGNKKGKKRPADVAVDVLKSEAESTQIVKRASDSTMSGPPAKIPRTEDIKVQDACNTENKEKESHSLITTVSAYPAPLYCTVSKFQSKEAMRKYFQHQTKDGPVMTYRIFKRINMILEYVKIHKVVDDYSKFLKLINEEEEREGLNMKIDKKSLLRLLIRLKEDGRLKLHSYLLTDGVKVKNMIFVCEQAVALDHPSIISAIEQAKMKLFIVNRDSINLASLNSASRSAQGPRAPNKKQKMTFLYDKKIGRKYGFCPKFLRMRTLHQFLFYLVYGYEGDSKLNQSTVIPFLESKDITVDDSLRSELTQVYALDVHWKMFIPPLPTYSGVPKGWSIMCDILLRLPLSLFVKIFSVCYVVVGLNEYLQHPVRRHFLVRQLPVAMRNGLMAFRKYIFSIHEVLQRLCYIGLIQFGPQRLKEKDQVLIFLNRRTSLLDTIPSKPGYHQISEEDYQEMKYEFKTMQDVETYWYNLWNICINTQLGGRMCVQGKDIVLEQLSFKAQMQEALQPVRPSRAPGRDTGEVPGDRRGAAGLDSAIFAHLKRNWNWANISAKIEDAPPKKVDRRKYRLMNLKAAPVLFSKSAIIVKRSINYLHKGRFNALHTERRSHTIPPGAEVLPKKGQRKQNIVRRIEARKTRGRHKPFYDDIDMKALQLMSKLRVEWSTEEDTLLLLCKVASVYLCPNPRQQTISLSIIRDVLHSSIPEAQNKTSRACQRRVLYMMKNLATSNNLAMHLEELKQDDDICERFGRQEENARGSHETTEAYEARIHQKFKLLVAELQSRSNRIVTASETYCSTIPDKAEDFWKLFDVVEPKTVIKSKGAFQDVKNIVDIHCSVVNTIIHSSLCSATDKTSWAYQLFRVYQQYPDSLLRAAMAKLRQDQMVSLKKSYTRYKQKGNYLPLSSSPYQLSVSYLQLIQTKYQYGVFGEAFQMMKELFSWLKETDKEQGLSVTRANGGGAATMVELLCKRAVSLSVEIPDQVIILDPWISEKDETYSRIVQRYKDILQTYRTGRDSTTSALFRLGLGNGKELENEDETENMNTNTCSENKKEAGYVEILEQSEDSGVSNSDDCAKNDASVQKSSEITPLPVVEQVADNSSKHVQKEDTQLEQSEEVLESTHHTSEEAARNSSTGLEPDTSRLHSDENKSVSDSFVPETPPGATPKFPDTENYVDKRILGEIENSSKLEKSLNMKLGRLDFEWTSDKEWAEDSDVPEHAVEEPEEPDVSYDERARGEEINMECGSEDETVNTQQTLVARAATRIALFMMKEEMDDSSQVKNNQHAHDFFVVNSCSVFCHPLQEDPVFSGTDKADVNNLDSKQENYVETKLLSVKPEKIEEVLNAIKSKAIVDIHPPSEEEIFKTDPIEYRPSMKSLMSYIESKKHLGATVSQLKTFYEKLEEKKLKLANAISYLIQQRIVMRTGVTTPRYVHLQHMWPWLAHTFKFLRLDREKVAPNCSRMVSCSEETDDNMDVENSEENDAEKTLENKKEDAEEMSAEPHVLQEQPNDDSFCPLKTSESENRITNALETDNQMRNNNIVDLGYCERENSLDEENSDKNMSEDEKEAQNQPCGENLAKEKVEVSLIGKRGPGRKPKQLTAPHLLGTIVGSKDMRKAAQNFDFSEKDEIHIFIRPWIRINGTLNRRVLDRLLGAVLGHAMFQPGQSLNSIGIRFQPALQSVYTRELIEILKDIGCVKLLVPQQRRKVTLFSKPQPVVLVDADGTEDDQDIIVEPQADAVCRLGEFIGEKSYNQDFMAAQEQMFSGRGSCERTRRRRTGDTISNEELIHDSETNANC